MLNVNSTREYLNLQKSLGISEMSNQNIRILDDDQKTSKIQKPKLNGPHNVHFTPKPPLPNTILGLYEDKIDINYQDSTLKKGDHLQMIEKLKRTLVPFMSGGLP